MERRWSGVIMAVLVVLMLMGCRTTMSYVELERVDQELSGNEGFLTGTAPPRYEERTVRPWQMIELEVELSPVEVRAEDRKSWKKQQVTAD